MRYKEYNSGGLFVEVDNVPHTGAKCHSGRCLVERQHWQLGLSTHTHSLSLTVSFMVVCIVLVVARDKET